MTNKHVKRFIDGFLLTSIIFAALTCIALIGYLFAFIIPKTTTTLIIALLLLIQIYGIGWLR